MNLACVMEVYISIFKTGTIANKCCNELLVLSKICHAALLLKILINLKRHEFIDNYKKEYSNMQQTKQSMPTDL
ncbi:hypothetical protein REPUB_Repub07fG0063900 [Reevesia pubescens]